MLSPFISVEDADSKTELQIALNSRLYDWVYTNRYVSSTTLEEIKELYRAFIEEYKIEELKA